MDDIFARIKKKTQDTINYFNPTSNGGDNFWRSPVAQGAANLQNNIVQNTKRVVQEFNTPMTPPDFSQSYPQQVKSNFVNMNPIRQLGTGARMTGIPDVAQYFYESGKDIAKIPSQMYNEVKGKSLNEILNTVTRGNPNAQSMTLSPSAQRGLEIGPSFIEGGALLPAVPRVPLNQVKNVADDVVSTASKNVDEILNTAKSQPGGMQAGFVKPVTEILKGNKVVKTVAPKINKMAKEAASMVNSKLDEILANKPVLPESSNIVTAVKTTKPGVIKVIEDTLKPIFSVMEKSGNSGKQMVNLIKTAEETGARTAGDITFKIVSQLEKLTPSELESFHKVVQGKMPPVSQNQLNAVNTWTEIAKQIRTEAVNSGLKVGNIEKYFPQFTDPSVKMTNEIRSKLGTSIGQDAQRRFGNLELARDANVPYVTDPLTALPKYIEGAVRRINDAKLFGAKDEILYDLAKKAGLEGGDTAQLTKYVDQILHKNQNPTAEAVSSTLRGIQSFKMNPITSIRNLTQNVSTLMKTDVGSVASAVKKIITEPDKAKEIWIRSGLSGQDFNRALEELSGASGKYIKGIGMKGTERINRLVAVNSGYEYASKLASQVEKGSKGAMRALKDLGFSVDEIVRGLKESDFITAGRRVSQKTQFSSNVGQLPYNWNTAAGKVITQFKPFGYQQTQFVASIAKRAGAEALKGNFKPLASIVIGLGAATVGGEVLNQVKSYFTNSKRQDTGSMKDRLLSDTLAGFSLGLVDLNTIQAAGGKFGLKGSLSTIGGPTVGTALDAGEAVKGLNDYMGGDQYGGRVAARDILKQIPVVGRTISNTVVPNSYIENYIGPNNGMNEPDKKVYNDLLASGNTAQAEAFKGKNMSVNKPAEPSFLDKILGKKQAPAPIPGPNATISEKNDWKTAKTAVINEGGVLSPEETKYYYFGDKKIKSPMIEERMDVYKKLATAMDNESYTPEQKQAILEASGASQKEYDYYTAASKDSDVKIQELLPKLESISDPDQRVLALMQMKRMVGGRSIVNTEVTSYLYENDLITEDEKKAIDSLQFDETNNKFYYTKAYLKKAGEANKLTYAQAKAIYKNIKLPSYNSLQGNSLQKGGSGAKLIEDILKYKPKKIKL